MLFNPERARRYARQLARPRRVGTGEDESVLAEIQARLEGFGYAVERQAFGFSWGATLGTALVILAGQVLVLLTLAAWTSAPLLSVLPAVALLGLLAISGRLNRSLTLAALAPPEGASDPLPARIWRRIGSQFQTSNLVALWPPDPAGPEPLAAAHLLLVAHSDSKSQAMSLVARMVLIGLMGLSGALFAVLSLLRLALPVVTPAAALAGLVALLAGVPLVFMFLAGPGNASPGAIDNASGVGTVLQLAETLSPPPAGVRITVLITSAEEYGLLGALDFVHHEAERLRRPEGGTVHVLNFDSVGIAGRLALVGERPSSRLAGLVRDAAAELGLALGRAPAIGALFDHIPFVEAGVDALSLVTTGPAARLIHTPADSAEQLASEGFRQAGEVALRVIAYLARDHEPAPGA